MLAGTIELEMRANFARLARDMDQVKGLVGGAMEKVESSVASAKAALGALGVGLSVGALVAFVKHTLDATAALDDFSEMTGASVESLSALRQVARVSDQDFGTVAGAMTKLAKGLAGVDDESKGAGGALQAIGLDLNTIKGLKADEQMQSIAVALNRFEDSSSKAAVAQALFGKSGAQLLPYLKDLAEWGQLNATVTAEQAAQAEQLQKSYARLKSDASDFGEALVREVIPPLQKIFSDLADGIKIAGSFADALMLFGTMNPFRTPSENLAAYKKELEEVLRVQAQWNPTMNASNQEARDLEKRIEYLKLKQRQDALALLDGTKGRLDAKDIGPTTKAVLDYSAAVDKAAKAYEAIQKKAADFIATLEKEAAQLGMTAVQKKAMDAATVALTLRTEKERMAVMQAVGEWALKTTEIELAEEAIKKLKEAEDQYAARLNALEEREMDAKRTLEQRVVAIEDETFALTATVAQLRELHVQRALEQSGLVRASEAWIEYGARLRSAMEINELTKTAVAQQTELWRSIESTAHDTFISIFDSGKSAFDRLRDTLKNGLYELLWQMTAKKWFFDVSVTGSGQGAAGAVSNAVSGGGGFNPFNLLSSGASLTNSVGNLSFAFADFTSLVDTGLGIFDAASIAFEGMASSFATFLPYVGVAVAIISLLMKEGGGPKTEGDYFGTIGAGGILTQQGTETGGDGVWYTGASADAMMAQIAAPIGAAVWQTIRDLGGDATGLGINLGYNTDPQGDAPDNVSAGVTDASGNYVYRQTYDVERGQAGEAMKVEAERILLAALQAVDLSPVIDTYLDALDIKSLTGEQAAAALKYVKALHDTGKAMERLGFGAESLTPTLINAAGGLESLQAGLSSFYDLYYTETEKQAMAQADLVAQFEALNLALPDSKDAFRDLVEGIDRSTTAGEEMFAALLRLAPAFAQAADAAEAAAQQATDAARQSADAQADMWRDYHASMEAAERAEAEARLRALEEQRRAAEEAQRIADQQAAAFATWTSGLREWLDALNQNDQLSPLTAQQKLLEAQNTYVEGLMLAQAGDASARGNITRYAEEYLAAQKAVTGFGGDYSSVFSSVRDQIDQLTGGGSSQDDPPTSGDIGTLPQDAPPTSGDIGTLRQEVTDLKVVLARLMEIGNADNKAQTEAIVAAITHSGNSVSTATTQAAVLTKKA